MKAAIMHGVDDLRYGDLPAPSLEAPDDVLIKVGAAGVCRTDLHTLGGHLAPIFGLPEPPYVLGHETAGWVEQTGSGVRGIEPGQPVLVFPQPTCRSCLPCRRGNDMFCEAPRFPGVDAVTWGGFREYMTVPANALVPLPVGADPAAFAAYTDAGLTAYHAVLKILPRLRAGSTAVVLGAGGVGQFAVQLLKLLGPATVVAIDVAPDKAETALELGADESVLANVDDPVEAVAGITDRRGADVVLDMVGEDAAPSQAVRMLGRGGTYSLVGYGGQIGIDTAEAVLKELTVVANLVGTYAELVELVSLAQRGLRSEFELHDLADADSVFAKLAAGQVKGRAILVPSA